MSARDLIRRAVRGADPAQLLEGLTEANLHVQVIDVANDKMLQDVRGDTKAQSKFDDFAKTYKQPRFLVQIVDIDRDRVLKTNEIDEQEIGLLTGNMGQTPKDRCDRSRKRARIRRKKNFSTLSAKVK